MKTTGRVGLFPVYRDNPYLNTMYLAARARGYETMETSTLDGAESILGRLAPNDVFHMQWTAPVVQRAETRPEAADRRERFERAITGARSRGVRLAWTIHNVLPHDARWHDEELALSRFLAAESDLIHVMSSGSAAMTADSYVLPPEKTVQVPHPSYLGTYPPTMSKKEARASFGIGHDDRVVLFFGQMRPYKGLSTLLRAAQLAGTRAGGGLVLLLAGRTLDADRPALEQEMPTTVRVIREHDYVADEDVQRWFAAADVAAFPYERVLNSGSLHLAATMGTPVLLPGEAHIARDFGAEPWVRLSEPGDVESLAALLSDSATYALPGASAIDFARRVSPFAVSNQWADVLDAFRANAV